MASREYIDDDDDEMPDAMDIGRSRQAPTAAQGGSDDEERNSEEEDDDEDDEEDEEEEEDSGRQRKRVKRGPKKPKAHRFLDLEVEVDDDDEDLDDDDEELGREAREFIDEDGGFDPNEPVNRRAAADHIRYNQQRELNERDLAELAQDYKDRYQRSAARYTGDADQVPQRLLMPSVNDPHLFQVRVKVGREKEIVFSLMRKYIDKEHGNAPLEIFSAFQRDSLPGLIYVEAHDAKQVSTALNGLVGAYVSSGVKLVPIDEMSSLLRIKRVETTVQPGAWVRIKRGKYAGDLAQVIDVTENGEEVGLKFIPRIDLTPRDDVVGGGIDPKTGKRKKPGMSAPTGRPPQRFFNVEEVAKAYGPRSVGRRQANAYVFMNDTYKDGFIEKDIRLTGIQTDNVNPTLDEITQFAGTRGDDGAPDVDLSAIADAARKAATAVLQPGDHVEVFEGEQTGVHGVVESISGEVVLIRATHIEIEGQKIEVPARSVRKRFKAGDHVKVMAGKNTDETGLVVSVTKDVVTFLSDLSLQEVTVFSKDLREAAEVGASTNTVGNYELHDLVLLGADSVGVIYKTEHSTFRVLDQNGQTRIVQPHQISMRRDSSRAIATDAHGHEIRVRDNMKEMDGEMRKGQVLHIHQSTYAFLHNRDIAENGGVFVTRARSLVSVAPKGPGTGVDLSKMNPAMAGGAGGMVGSGILNRAPRDRLIGVSVMVTKGLQKGYVGTIKETNGNIVRVELSTNNKVISIEKDKLRMKGQDGKYIPLTDGFPRRNHNGNSMGPPALPGPGPGSGANSGWGTPASNRGGGGGWGSSPSVAGRTQNPYGGKTPGWGEGARTPFGGGKTPAWNASTTSSPYVGDSFGGKTPGGAGSSGWGGATPGRPGWGGATPGRPSGTGQATGGWGGATPARPTNTWGGATPARPAGSWGGATPARTAGSWGGATPSGGAKDSWGGATPGRPGASTAGQTPGGEWGGGGDEWGSSADSAQTPFTAPTPGAGPISAPTPGVPLSAPTPGAFSTATSPAFGSGYGSAPTPGVFGMTPGGY
ncbi:transcription elongation factor spt5, partial [Ceratobasidium sp. 370]